MYAPPLMKTMPGSAAKARTRGQARRPILLTVNVRELIGWDNSVRAERIDIRVCAAGWRVVNRLRPIDPQRGIHGGDDVFDARLLLVVPARVDGLIAILIARAQHQPAFDAGA